jgi:hypothetical protein
VTSLKRFNSYEIFYDGKGKGDILGQVTSLKRFNSYEIFYDGSPVLKGHHFPVAS